MVWRCPSVVCQSFHVWTQCSAISTIEDQPHSLSNILINMALIGSRYMLIPEVTLQERSLKIGTVRGKYHIPIDVSPRFFDDCKNLSAVLFNILCISDAIFPKCSLITPIGVRMTNVFYPQNVVVRELNGSSYNAINKGPWSHAWFYHT